MPAEKIVRIEAKILATTQKAVLIEYEGEQHWLPRSGLVDDEDLQRDTEATVKLESWLAKKEGLA